MPPRDNIHYLHRGPRIVRPPSDYPERIRYVAPPPQWLLDKVERDDWRFNQRRPTFRGDLHELWLDIKAAPDSHALCAVVGFIAGALAVAVPAWIYAGWFL